MRSMLISRSGAREVPRNHRNDENWILKALHDFENNRKTLPMEINQPLYSAGK